MLFVDTRLFMSTHTKRIITLCRQHFDFINVTPNAVIKRDLKVPSVRQEVRNYSVTYRQRLDGHPNRLAKSFNTLVTN